MVILNGTTMMIITTIREERPANDVSDGFFSDDPIEIMNVVLFVFVCQGFSVFGTIANILNLIVFIQIGFSDTIYISLTALAFTDFGACFFLIWHTIALNPWFEQLEMPFGTWDILYLTSSWPHVIFTRLTTILTAFISFERCLCVILPLKVKTIVTTRLVKIVVTCTFVSGVLKVALVYSTHWYGRRFYSELNKTLIGLVFSENREDLENVYFPILYIAIPFICFIIVAVSAVLLVSALLKNSKWKRQVVYSNQRDANAKTNHSFTSKEMKVAKMVTIISAIYICCSIPHVVFMFVMTADRSVSIDGANRKVMMIMGSVLFLLQSINSACNIFVYYNNSSAYRTKFNQIFHCEKQKVDR